TTDHYGTYCLPCHSLGYNLNPLAVNNGFDDIAARLNFDLNQIPDMVHDAYVNGSDHWEDLPVELRGHGNIQCESCHGAGARHPANLTQLDAGIGGVNLDLDQCAQCHDSASGFQQQFYQWGTSAHKLSAEAAHNTGCVKCHTAEGFVDVQVNGLAPVDH